MKEKKMRETAKKNKKKILFGITNNFFKEILLQIAKELEKRGYDVTILTNSNIILKYVLKHSSIKVYHGHREGKKIEPRFNANKFKALCKKYNFNRNVNYFREYHIMGRTYGQLDRYVFPILAFMNKFFEKREIDYFINCGESIFNVCLWDISQKLKIDYYQTNWLGYVPGKHYWDDDIHRFTWVKEQYLKTKPSPQEVEAVKAYLTRSKKKKKVQGFKKQGIFTYYYSKKFAAYLYNYFAMGPGRIETYSPLNLFKRWSMRLFKDQLFKKYYKKLGENEKFFYFPLHLHYDASITFSNQKFYRQDKIAKLIAKNLPKGYYLVTKEHPIQTGMFPLKWMSKISKIPNVKILPPDTNSHDLIKKSAGIITICSSVGWEAIQYKKPVITLATSFYDFKSLTIPIRDMKKLKEGIKKLLSPKKFNQKELYTLVNAMLKSHYNCNYFKDGTTVLDRSTQNIKKLTDVIETEFFLRNKLK